MSWLANSAGTNDSHIQNMVSPGGACVAPDGKVWVAGYYDEGGHDLSAYQNGALVDWHAVHGFGYWGGNAVTRNASVLYFSQQVVHVQGYDDPGSWPDAKHFWVGVSCRDANAANNPRPFTGGKGGAPGTVAGSFLVVEELPTSVPADSIGQHVGAEITGLAASATRLYVSSPYSGAAHKGQIKVYDVKNNYALLHAWDFAAPGQLALDKKGLLWAVQGTAVKALDPSGKPAGQLTLPEGTQPYGLGYDRAKHLLYVTDTGPDLDIKVFDLNRTGAVLRTYGVRGGAFAGKGNRIGTVGPWRFTNPFGVGVDGSGNLYVADHSPDGAGLTIHSYRLSDLRRNWAAHGLVYMQCADVDPDSETDVYDCYRHYKMNYNNTRPGTEWSWYANALNRLKYPGDPRIGPVTSVWLRRLNGGKLYMYSTSQFVGCCLAINRQSPTTDGECFVPSGVIANIDLAAHNVSGGFPKYPAGRQIIWRDRNGNGKVDEPYDSWPQDGGGSWPYVDRAGTVWYAVWFGGYIRKFPLQEFDAHDNPIYTVASSATIKLPAPFNEVRRLEYDSDKDQMYLCGFSNRYPAGNHKNNCQAAGRILCRYSGWKAARNPSTLKPDYTIVLPWNPDVDFESTISFSVAGGYVFAGLSTPYVSVYDKATGAFVTRFDFPGRGTLNASLMDQQQSLKAYRRANGEYLIFVENDNNAGIWMIRWKP
jgi:hypothetical protein